MFHSVLFLSTYTLSISVSTLCLFFFKSLHMLRRAAQCRHIWVISMSISIQLLFTLSLDYILLFIVIIITIR